MSVLAIETSGPLGSVAVEVEGRVVARRFLAERGRHAALLPEAMQRVLDEAGLAWGELSGVAVGTGPGSFTGVRVAASAANGVAHARGVPVYPVSSLAAAAVALEALPPGVGPWAEGADGARPSGSAAGDALPRRVLFDARADRLFTAVYEVTGERVVTLSPPTFATLAELVPAPGAGQDAPVRGVVCVGDGAAKHESALRAGGFEVLGEPHGVPAADGVLEVLRRTLDPVACEAGAWEPTYLRDTGAVRARTASA